MYPYAPSHLRRALVSAAAAAALAACTPPPAEPPPPDEPAATVLYAYTLLAPPATTGTGPQVVARVIVDGAGAPCPAIGNIPTTSRDNPDAANFSVTVCEALVPPGQATSVGGMSLPAVNLDPQSLTIFGDTGCHHGDCTGADTPFKALAGIAATLSPAPDLILHVGDYNYRGTSSHVPLKSDPSTKLSVYDAGDDAPSDEACQLTSTYVSQNAGYSGNPDQWNNWMLDFFEPAKSLFPVAPFVFARGNHELCSRAGPGWFYFLDPSGPATGTAQAACPPQGGDSAPPPPATADGHYVILPSYTIELATLDVAVLDSANACDGHAPFSDCTTHPTSPVCVSATQLSELFAAAPAGKRTWLLSHRPFWGAEAPDNGDCSDTSWSTINSTLQASLAQAGSIPAALELAVAGHMHRFQTLTFTGSETLPPQLIVGDSGVKLDDFDPSPCAFNTSVGGQPATGVELNQAGQYGFLHVTGLGGSGWQGKLLGPSGTMACCDSSNPPGSVCTLGACS